MNFIHNITLNFNDDLYEAYEWEPKDKLIYVKKIPIFKVSKKDYFQIKYNIVRFGQDFLDAIYKQGNVLKYSKDYTYISLIACEEDVIAIKLNKDGTVTKKSSLSFEEIKPVLRAVNKLNKSIFNYTVLKESKTDDYSTRLEKEELKKIFTFLQNLYNKNDIDKLSYLYLECFNEVQKNKDLIISKLKQEISNKSDVFYKTVDFFKLITQNL